MQPWRPNSAVMAAAATRASGSGRGGGPLEIYEGSGRVSSLIKTRA